jgi:hypothetical protein
MASKKFGYKNSIKFVQKFPLFQIVGNSFKEETLFSFAHILEKEEIFEQI